MSSSSYIDAKIDTFKEIEENMHCHYNNELPLQIRINLPFLKQYIINEEEKPFKVQVWSRVRLLLKLRFSLLCLNECMVTFL